MATARMQAYRSRLQGWARNAGMADPLKASNEDLVAYLREKRRLPAFYRAFPMYDPESDAYELGA